MTKQKRRIYCKFCDFFCYDADDFVSHLEKHHEEIIPEDMTPWQFSYYLRTGKTHGNCVICKGKTLWNEKTHKYNRLCGKEKCNEAYRDIFKNRMIGKYGKSTLLNDPEQQKKMLANRKISGEYMWRDHVHKTTYTGSYEKSFLEFLDVIMNFDPSDIMAPSPHTYWYTYEGKKHFYIPDFFIPSLELEIEIKDGGDNANMHPKIQAVDKEKEKLKDDVMMHNQFNYIKIINKNNKAFFDFLELSKEHQFDKVQKPIYLLESFEDSINDSDIVFESVFTESIHKSTLSKNFKKKDNKDINSSAIDIHSGDAKWYIDNDSYLSSLKPKLKNFNGEIIVDNDKKKIIGRFLIGTGKDEGFIGALRVNDAYKGYGFGAQLIDDAVKKYNGTDLIVLKDNEVALHLYKKHGFVIVDINDNGKNEYYMKLKSKVNKDDKVITEACADLNKARELAQKVRDISKEYNANFYFVTDGASSTSNNGNEAVKTARDAVAKWERENGFDDKEDWSSDPKDFSNYKLKKESVSEEDSNINDLAFKNPKELLDWMHKNIKYVEFSKLMTPEDVFLKKKGSCHDQVMLEDYFFKKMNIDHGKLFLIEYTYGKEAGGRTHSLIYYKDHDKFYWFENAWSGEQGIHGPFNSIKELKDSVKEKMLQNSKFESVEFGSMRNVKYGCSLQQLVDECL